MIQLPLLPEPNYSPVEREHIVSYVHQLNKTTTRKFLEEHKIAVSGTKQQIRERIEDRLAQGQLSYADLVSFIDSVQPWGDQHIFLFEGPRGSHAEWKSPVLLQRYLASHRLSHLLNQHLPLILPQTIKLSSIQHIPKQRLRVTAVERRDAWIRNEELDHPGETQEGVPVQYRAFVQEVGRGIIAFEWDFNTNTAFLQVTELPSHSKYEDALKRFAELVARWLDLDAFSPLDLRPAIKWLHEREERGQGETRSHGIDYVSPSGRRLLGRSASADSPLLGERAIDAALEAMRRLGVGREGNFYFLATPIDPSNPIADEVHAIILAEKGRIHFTKANDESVIRHVLQRIQTACREAS